MNLLTIIYLTVILVAFGYLIYVVGGLIKATKEASQLPEPKQDQLHEVLSVLAEEAKERRTKRKEQELADYAKAKQQVKPTPVFPTNSTGEEKVSTKNLSAEKILIPEGLNELEKQILRDFFDL
jgi:hypothetical protein